MSILVLFSFVTLFMFLFTLRYHATLFPKIQRRPRGPPGPLALPIIGHLHLLGPNLHRCFHEMSRRYGPLFHLRLGSVPCVVASDTEMAKAFLKTNELSFTSRKHSRAIKLLTYDVSFAFAPYGPYWKFINKLCVYELLGTRNLRNFKDTIKMEVHGCLSDLMRKATADHDEEINVSEEILKLTNNVISQMMLSIRWSAGESEAQQARTVIRAVTEIFGEFDLSDVIWFCRNFDLQGIRKRANDIHRRYDRLLEQIISDRERQRTLKRMHRQQDEGSFEANDFLDMLLDAMENERSEVKLTRNHIKALILDFFTAATDTTAIAIEWALAELINNPKVLKKAQEEINKVVGIHRLAEESDVPHFSYIQAIIKETFRLHPPIPMISRKSVTDCTVAGYAIPANTLLFVNIWSIGRSPKYWDNPLEFRPERFLEPNNNGDPTRIIDLKGQHFELLPFGTGRRGCPGMSLAMQELPTILALVIQCFDFEVPSLRGETTKVVDMAERPGLTAPRASDLICRLKARIDPLKMLYNPLS